MAGAVKHMKRSHRSYGKNVDFRGFENHAFKVASAKEHKSLFDRIKGAVLHKHQDK